MDFRKTVEIGGSYPIVFGKPPCIEVGLSKLRGKPEPVAARLYYKENFNPPLWTLMAPLLILDSSTFEMNGRGEDGTTGED